MKWTVSINQAGADSAKLRGVLDLIDLAIFDAFKDFANSGRCQKFQSEGVLWFWIDYKIIIDELPYSGLKTKDAVYRRMKKLAAADVIIFNPTNQAIGRTFFCWGRNYDSLVSTSNPTDETRTLRMKPRRGTEETPKGYGQPSAPPTDETPNYPNTNTPYTNPPTIDPVPQNEFAATNPEQPPTPKGAKKKKTSPGSGAPPPKIPAWTSKVKDLFDRVNEEESQSAKVEHIPYETTAAPGRDFAAFKALRTCIEKKIGTDPEETVLLSSFEYLFRYGFRYLHSIALSKGGAIQYSPLTIQHSYNQIRQYAASFNRKPSDPIKDLAATFIAEHRAKVSGQI
jgi:hypothetical protein